MLKQVRKNKASEEPLPSSCELRDLACKSMVELFQNQTPEALLSGYAIYGFGLVLQEIADGLNECIKGPLEKS